METDDAVWIAAMAALEPDALLEELLADIAPSHISLSPRYPSCALRGRANVSKSLDISSSSSSADGETDDANKPPPKRRRVRNSNPKKELEGLRRAAADLENLLLLARQRSKSGRVAPMLLADQMNTANCTPKEAMWMGVATRQYKLMRESQIQNEHLRAQVLNQMHTLQGIFRLVQRANAGLPSECIPRGLRDAAEVSISSKRQEVQDIVAQLYESIDEAVASDLFESSTLEQNVITTTRFQDQLIPPGALLASGLSRRYVPQSLAEVSDQMWVLDLPKTRPAGSFDMGAVENEDEIQSFHGTVDLSATDKATIVVVRRARDWGPSRRSVVSACLFAPDPTCESPWNAIGSITKQWIDIRESNNEESLVEVRSRTDLIRSHEMFAEVSPLEARGLEEYTRKTIAFVVNRLQNKLDSMLLGSSGDVVLAL